MAERLPEIVSEIWPCTLTNLHIMFDSFLCLWPLLPNFLFYYFLNWTFHTSQPLLCIYLYMSKILNEICDLWFPVSKCLTDGSMKG